MEAQNQSAKEPNASVFSGEVPSQNIDEPVTRRRSLKQF
jgi:hypothetical protein